MNLRRYLTIVFLVWAVSTGQAAAKHWIHVHVDSDADEKVRVNLPMSLLSAALPILQSKHLEEAGFSEGRLRLEGHELSVSELREIWVALKAEGSFELANIVSTDANVQVLLQDDHLLVKADDAEGDRVHVQVPVQVVDALLSGEGDELNVTAAVEALSQVGNQELVRVESKDAIVRVWIDESNN
jgi:hypothetical protein